MTYFQSCFISVEVQLAFKRIYLIWISNLDNEVQGIGLRFQHFYACDFLQKAAYDDFIAQFYFKVRISNIYKVFTATILISNKRYYAY